MLRQTDADVGSLRDFPTTPMAAIQIQPYAHHQNSTQVALPHARVSIAGSVCAPVAEPHSFWVHRRAAATGFVECLAARKLRVPMCRAMRHRRLVYHRVHTDHLRLCPDPWWQSG